jgi:STE24 endopeptidase
VANEDKSTRYHRLRRRTSLLDTTAQAILLLALVSSGASSAIRASVETSVGTSLVPLVVMYVIVIAALSEIVHLPFAFYHGVILERRYGLSTEKAARWLKDHFKAAAIVLIVLSGAGVLVAWLLRVTPAIWWLVASIAFVTGLVLLARSAPVFLLPLFYDVRPLTREALRERLVALAAKAGTPVLGAYEWRVGDRTTKANAALVGIGRTRRIMVSDTLLTAHSDDEIETVFARAPCVWRHLVRAGARGCAADAWVLCRGLRAVDVCGNARPPGEGRCRRPAADRPGRRHGVPPVHAGGQCIVARP